ASLAVALTILIELVGGILLMLGWKTRLAALSLLSFTVVATAVFHSNIMEQAQQVAFLKNVSIVGGLLYAHLFGPGRLSIDERTSGSGMET
ncbi:MAG TPA: DoxX family protein, partial [Candidatus Paceibacterota bacterium]